MSWWGASVNVDGLLVLLRVFRLTMYIRMYVLVMCLSMKLGSVFSFLTWMQFDWVRCLIIQLPSSDIIFVHVRPAKTAGSTERDFTKLCIRDESNQVIEL